jgi:hypothetical protein
VAVEVAELRLVAQVEEAMVEVLITQILVLYSFLVMLELLTQVAAEAVVAEVT